MSTPETRRFPDTAAIEAERIGIIGRQANSLIDEVGFIPLTDALNYKRVSLPETWWARAPTRDFTDAELDHLLNGTPFPSSPGYHIDQIPRGVFGEFSKIEEEIAEAKDAAKQECKVMELVELSDVIGAIKGYLAKHHPSILLSDLIAMADTTDRAFRNGHRVSK